MSIFPSQEVLDGIFEGLAKTAVWRDINILHKQVNRTFFPSRFVDDASRDNPLLILKGIININGININTKITLSRNYINNRGKGIEEPTFVIDVPEESTIFSDMFNGHQLNIRKFIPDFDNNPSISNIVNTFSTYFTTNELFRKGSDIIESVKPMIDRFNNSLQKANAKKQKIALYQDLNDTLQRTKVVLTQYGDALKDSISIYEAAANEQKLEYTEQFETILGNFGKFSKYKKTQEMFTQLVTERKITINEYINFTRELAAMQFENIIRPPG